jgi:hypothetical protein
MTTELHLNQEVTLQGKTYKVIGIDHYHLKNILGGNAEWKSYTLIDSKKNKTWISYGSIPNYFIQWATISEAEFKKQATNPLNLDSTGIAHIEFEGNPGYSTPNAELMLFNVANQSYDYVGMERFLKQNNDKVESMESYFQTGTLLKDFKI